MISGAEFIKTAKFLFSFLENELGFVFSSEKNNENLYYELRYSHPKYVVSIAYENIEDYFQIVIFRLMNAKLPDYDNKEFTLHLNKLNAIIFPHLTKENFASNDQYFKEFQYQDPTKQKLLKGARELRLCLKYVSVLESRHEKIWKYK